ncbi:MAG: hypothetical protein AAB728_01300, partial [Patescibacteria group bacterium]
EVRSQSGAWAMRMTRRTDPGEGLWTATIGRRLFLSNDPAWLLQVMMRNPVPSLTLSPGPGTPTMGGIVERTALRGFFKNTLNLTLPSTLLSTFGPQGDRFLWSVSHTGLVATVTVEGE